MILVDLEFKTTENGACAKYHKYLRKGLPHLNSTPTLEVLWEVLWVDW